MGDTLTTEAYVVLIAMADAAEKQWAPETGPELSRRLYGKGRGASWIYRKLRALQARSFIEVAGVGARGAPTYRITAAGRSALSDPRANKVT